VVVITVLKMGINPLNCSIDLEREKIWKMPVHMLKLFVFQFYVSQDILRYCMAVCLQICQFLEIYCFDIVTPYHRKKSSKQSWRNVSAFNKGGRVRKTSDKFSA
jgi:hypothetical protein